MRVEYIVCAQSVSVDQFRNTLSLFHIIEEISSASFPFVIPSFVIVVGLSREPNDPTDLQGAFYRMVLGQGEVLNIQSNIVHFHQRARSRALLNVAGMVVPAPGVLRATFNVEGKQLGEWTIDVIDVGEPTIQEDLPLEAPESAKPIDKTHTA